MQNKNVSQILIKQAFKCYIIPLNFIIGIEQACVPQLRNLFSFLLVWISCKCILLIRVQYHSAMGKFPVSK